jgi:hypothetical protein
MALPRIKQALEKHLAALSPALSTAVENISFTPVLGTPYQDVQIVPRAPDNQTLGDGYYRESGELQVFLCYPSGAGSAACMTRAILTRDHFKRGTTLSQGGIEVIIMSTPKITSGSVFNDRYVIGVFMEYSCGVLKV